MASAVMTPMRSSGLSPPAPASTSSDLAPLSASASSDALGRPSAWDGAPASSATALAFCFRASISSKTSSPIAQHDAAGASPSMDLGM